MPISTPHPDVMRLYRFHSRLWSPARAGNLAALGFGLRAAKDGWTPEQIAACLFWKWLYEKEHPPLLPGPRLAWWRRNGSSGSA